MSATKTRIMYIQAGWGPGRIGRVRFSKTGRTLHYGDLELVPLSGGGSKANYLDAATRNEYDAGAARYYWVSGPRKDGQDTLSPGVVEIDDDVRDEYWRTIRAQPANAEQRSFRSRGAHAKHSTR